MSRADRVTLRNKRRAGEMKGKGGIRLAWHDHPLNQERRARHNRIVKQQQRR